VTDIALSKWMIALFTSNSLSFCQFFCMFICTFLVVLSLVIRTIAVKCKVERLVAECGTYVHWVWHVALWCLLFSWSYIETSSMLWTTGALSYR